MNETMIEPLNSWCFGMNETVIEQLNRIARTCEQAIYETEMAVDDPEKGYPYASGYSKSALKNVLEDVQFILKNNK